MRTLFLAFVLSSSIVLALVGEHFGDDEFGDSDFDSDWFWIGSNLPSVGRPKFKITEHPDGYSMQLGFSGYYMRIRYTESDHSLDFNIMGYKGSVKYRLDDHYSDGTEFEGTFEIAGSQTGRSTKGMDAKIRVKYSKPKTGQYRSGDDPMNIELHFVNKFKRGERNYINMPSMRMRGAQDLDAIIKMTIDPRNWAESTLNFEMNAKGDIYRYMSENDYDENWFPGSYNLSASLAVINLVEMSPTQRQPKMTAALDLEEDITFDEQEQDVEKEVPRNQKLLKKSMLIDGMINLTGKGSRMGVIKLTDADSNKSIGRIQARHPDNENYRLEIFANGEQFAAVNYFQNIAGVTNITVEDNPYPDHECPEATFDDYEVSNTTSLNYTDVDEEFLNITDVSESFSNYTNVNVTNYHEEEAPKDLWESCKIVNRVLESISGEGVYESRMYNDVFFIGDPLSYRMRETEGTKGLIFEEKMAQKNDTYEGHIMFGSWEKNTLHCKLDNDGTDTNVEIGASNKYMNERTGEYRVQTDDKINIDITHGNEEDDFNMKLSYNNERIFDGWFYLTALIHRYARQNVPAMIDRQLESFKDTHSETTQYVSNFF